MAKGKVLDDYVRHLIASIHLEHQDWLGKQVHAELHRILRTEKYPRATDSWPSLSAVQKVLAQYRTRAEELHEHPDDRPWSLLALSQSEIEAQALPLVIRAWARAIASGVAFTIREAKWVARVSCLHDEEEELILALADWLAAKERTSFLVGHYPTTEREILSITGWGHELRLYKNMKGSDRVVGKIHGTMYAIQRAPAARLPLGRIVQVPGKAEFHVAYE